MPRLSWGTYFWGRTVVEDWRVLDPQTLNVTYFWSRTVVENRGVLDAQTLLGDLLLGQDCGRGLEGSRRPDS